MKELKFNINDEVRVRLTDIGREIYFHKNDKMNERIHCFKGKPFPQKFPEEDADGWYTTQLWELMKLFGRHINMGSKNPFETEIILLSKNN